MPVSVGIRDFRASLSSYVDGKDVVALTRHGQTVGWFIPTPSQKSDAIETLKQAGKTLDLLLQEQGVDPEEIVSEYRHLRHKRAKSE